MQAALLRVSPARWARMLANRRAQAILAQVGGGAVLVLIIALLTVTLIGNLQRLNLTAGYGFLLRPAGMRMGESVIAFEPTDSFLWAMVAAGINTVRVAAAGIVLATILGTAVGVMRLSTNPLLRALTGVYVEVFRNTPLLLQILFWSAILLKLPGIRQAISLDDWAFLSQRGLQVPALLLHADVTMRWIALGVGAVTGIVAGWLLRRSAAAVPVGLAACLVVAIGLLSAVGGLGVERPVKKLFGFAGGMTLTPEFCALLAGLVAYTGAFIAEIVRGGILAVPRGQWEAARSLGLRDRVIMRRIVLPQALRVILPSLTSQYVSAIKNSSLAVAIGYPDLFWSISTAINVTGHAIEGVTLLMVGYLVLTLGMSAAMNGWYARILRRGGA